MISSIIEKLIHISLQEIRMIQAFDTKKEMKKLEKVLKKIQPILEDAEEKQLGDEEVNDFIERLKVIAHAAEDFLDDWLTDIQHRQQQKSTVRRYGRGIWKKNVGSSLYLFGGLSYFLRGKKLRIIRKKLEKMEVESFTFGLYNRTEPLKDTPFVSTNGNLGGGGGGGGTAGDDGFVCGREFDKEIILKKLFEGNMVDNREVKGARVVSIVGIGGIGKTSLAQSVYNDDEVKSHFDARVWISVPQTASSYLELTVQRILQGLSSSSSVDDFTCIGDFYGADMLHLSSLLSNNIKQKKFLLVLDDVWNEDIHDWQALKSLLVGASGSSILILTRNKMAAYLMSTTTLHELQPLSKESAWELFCRNAFAKQDDADTRKPFEDIGKIVLQRCNGVPLALKCLGGMLRTKTTRQEWEDVMESDKWELLEMEPILPALYFSYYSLPPILKLCLSYTAIFPKAYEIDKGMLIKLWMAESFLGSSTTKDRDLEFIGDECFRELMMRSYFNPHERNKDGEVNCIKMHDLVHDLAASMCGHSVVEINNKTFKINKARHLSVLRSDIDSIPSSVRKANPVSTLKLFECRVISKTVSPHLFAHLKFLRILDLSYLGFTEMPNQVGKLKHLRYLNLSHTNLQSLPENVCDLHNLQTLILNHCKQLFRLPDNLVKLSGLRHLEIQSTPKLLYLPLGTGRLTSLRTLSKFPVSIGCRIGELQDLNKLQGYIHITGLQTVKNLKEANEAKLMNKENLHELWLDFSPYNLENLGDDEFRKTESVLEYLHPHLNIKRMTLTHFLGSKLPRWLENDSSLPNLRSLKIQDCVNCTMLPALGNLPSLEELYIENLGSIKDIGNGFYGIGSSCKYVKETAFPKLEELHIVDMAKLEHWDFIAQDEKIMPCIRDLDVRNCPKLIVLPHFFPDTLKNVNVSHCAKLTSSALDKFGSQERLRSGHPRSAASTKEPPESSEIHQHLSFDASLPP
ncbi:hypothetical protein MKX01_035420 [Papaver californicum]|nr:hypothetical protein MKX01_035420 [Papaver californicum]